MTSIARLVELNGLRCSDKGKIILINLWTLCQNSPTVRLTIREFAETIGIPHPTVSKLLAMLERCDLIAVERVAVSSGGHPQKLYALSGATRELIELADTRSGPHDQSVEWLLNEPSEGLSTAYSQLSPSQRLLLAFLLCSANRAGVVRHTGLKEIRAATGISEHQLRAHTKQFQDQGILRSVLKGATCRNVLGIVRTCYWIDLHMLSSASGGNLEIEQALFTVGVLSDLQPFLQLSELGQLAIEQPSTKQARKNSQRITELQNHLAEMSTDTASLIKIYEDRQARRALHLKLDELSEELLLAFSLSGSLNSTTKLAAPLSFIRRMHRVLVPYRAGDQKSSAFKDRLDRGQASELMRLALTAVLETVRTAARQFRILGKDGALPDSFAILSMDSSGDGADKLIVCYYKPSEA